MNFRIFITAFAVALSSSGIAQVKPATVASAVNANAVRVALDTSAGRIVLELDRERAPITSVNFLKYITSGKYNGEAFYRAMPYGQGGLIQGGIRSDARKLAPGISHEPTATTGIKHVAGTVSMANAGPGTARSDFFILTTDIPAFDASFAAFGGS
jgi:peptidyl-prolyl cis-trans isomerase A (cyclophilin A)